MLRRRDHQRRLAIVVEGAQAVAPEAEKIVREILDSLILKQEAKRWAGSGRP